MAEPRILTGAHVFLYVNSVPLGRATSFKWSDSTPSKVIRGVDDHRPQELAPTTSEPMFEIGVYRTWGDGGAEGMGISALTQHIPRLRYFSVMLVDRVHDLVLFRADYCRLEDQSWSVTPKAFATGMIKAKCLDWSNEITSL